MAANPLLGDFWGAVQPHVAWLHRQLLRLGVRTADVDDVTQELLITLYRRRDEYDPARPLRAYLFGYLFRMASDYRRKSHRRHERVGAWAPESVSSTTPEDHASARAELDLVQRALEQLPEERRDVFVMAVIEQYSAPEVAEALGVPLNTVYSRLRVARVEFVDAVRTLRIADEVSAL